MVSHIQGKHFIVAVFFSPSIFRAVSVISTFTFIVTCVNIDVHIVTTFSKTRDEVYQINYWRQIRRTGETDIHVVGASYATY